MSKEVSIKKLVLDLGGKEVTLTLKEAKALKDALDELFVSERIVERHNRWVYPYVDPWPYRRPYVTWTANSSGVRCQMNSSGTLNLALRE